MIQGISTSTTSLLDTGRTGASGAPGVATAGAAKTAAPEDRAAVTSTVAALAGEGAPIDGDRIAALRAGIKAGSYRPDPSAIAQRMVDTDLGAGL